MPKTKCANCNKKESVAQAVRYLKVLANQERMQVMCNISQEPHSVSELMEITGLMQSTLSMHLSKLRKEEMVETRKQGRSVYYSISDPRIRRLVQYLCQEFGCQ